MLTATILAPSPCDLMSPGTYLAKRREAAGLGLRQAAASIAALPWPVRRAAAGEVIRMAVRLGAAEADTLPFPLAQAEVIRSVFPFDVGIYELLKAHHIAGPGCGLAVPQLCRECACSWQEPCLYLDPFDDAGIEACAWSADATLCTRCEELLMHPPIVGPSVVVRVVEVIPQLVPCAHAAPAVARQGVPA